ncbi:MAG: NADH-quinone oxidoreductase subunit J, partial [Chloroflexi bacterium]|nr:NADH-quinone oxidoreductase subunit J [Chloroflexota bacterium]
MELSLFFLLALIAMLAAGGMLLSRNAVYSALFLIVNFATVAVFFLLLGAPFIAMAQVTVYAGAIMVLFLFVIMLLGAERLRQKSVLPWQA